MRHLHVKYSLFFGLSGIWAISLLTFIVSILSINGCSEEDDPSPQKTSGLEDIIPYEVLGGGKLVFLRDYTFYIIDSDNQTSWGLTGVNEAIISPDGAYIAYVSPPRYKYQPEIFVFDIQNNKSRKVSDLPWGCYMPGWTADSKNIIFEEYADNDKRVLFQQSMESDVRSMISAYRHIDNITSMISVSKFDNLAFSFITTIESTGQGISGIFTMNLNGTKRTQITFDTHYVRGGSPVWSPDGNLIAYIKYETDGNYFQQTEILLMDQNGTNATTLAKFQAVGNHRVVFGRDPSVTWSPDGTKLAFNMYEDDGIHIYIINADGTGLMQVTSKMGATDGRLSWSK